MTNRLGKETSPYLLQHAGNPVDWFPWCDEAFESARKSGKPILLSIGYSACHWCHVMAHESFENEATAAVMNRLFVNIKVDREERPDIDRIYQTAHQLLTHRSGGWPLTMFLDASDQRPFFGGTYFPDERRYGMPSFREILDNVAEYYSRRRDEVREHAARLSEILGQLEPAGLGPGDRLNFEPLRKIRIQIAQSFDREFGGFGPAPKFPHPATIEHLLRHWRATANGAEPDIEALFMATLTLTRMAEGGIYDHLGGGFCRYSVDRYWQIPHFEKMLYDNGSLLAVYAQAQLATGETLFSAAANRTADWLLTDMRSPDGSFYSARDADSEGEEGRYYVWTAAEVADLLEPDDYAPFAARFGLDEDANFEGRWHLAVRRSLEEVASTTGKTNAEVAASIGRSRAALLAARSRRVAPGLDDKQLTAWNALVIRGLAIAGSILGRQQLVDAASDAVEFTMRSALIDGRLRASFKDGRARFPAYLDDHAFLIDALVELLQVRWNSTHLGFAVQLAELLLEHFEDRDAGGFYFTADDHETLMYRPKPFADEATPSGNGVAAFALQRLGYLLGEPRYSYAAERTLCAAWKAIEEYPQAHVTLLKALDEFLEPPDIIIIRGSDDEANRWREAAASIYAPRRLVFAIAASEAELPGTLADRRPSAGETIAYRCRGTHCELPVTTFEALTAQLSEAN